MAQHNDLGTKGEQMACDYLSRKGYKIIARNWRLNKYEVDIIAQLRNEIIFVEGIDTIPKIDTSLLWAKFVKTIDNKYEAVK